MKRGILIILAFLLVISTVSALEVEYQVLQEEALPGNEVSYKIMVKNNEPNNLIASIKSADLNWLIKQDIIGFSLAPGQTKEYNINFQPLSGERVKPGRYGIRLIVETNLTSLEKLLPCVVLSYDKVLDVNFTSKPIIDPRKTAIISIEVSNANKINLANLNVEISSPHFEFTRSLDLSKEESKILDIPVEVDSSTVRGEYESNVKITLNNNLMVDKKLSYLIEEYEDLKELIVPQEGFLLGGEKVTQINDGNTPSSQKIIRRFSWFSYKFTTFDTKPDQVAKVDGKYLLEWNSVLGPKESKTISYKTNYRAPATLIFVIVIAIIIWYFLRQKHALVISKKPLLMKTPTGNIKVLKILISIKNRGTLSIKNIKIIDRIPSEIKAPLQHGSLKPSHVQSSPQGTVLVWNIQKIRPGEERVLSYRLEGNIQINKSLLLPNTLAKYTSFYRKIASRSPSVSIKEKKTI